MEYVKKRNRNCWVAETGADGLIFAERLGDLIYDSGKTAKQIAVETGLKESTISDYKRGKNNRIPDSESIRVLAHYFQVSYEYLYGEVRASRKENYSISQFYGLTDRTAELLRNMQLKDDSTVDDYTQRMLSIFNELFRHGFADLLLDAVMLDLEMERLKADVVAEDVAAINLIVGNRHKDRPKGTAIVSQEDFYALRLSEIEKAFGSILHRSLRSHKSTSRTD